VKPVNRNVGALGMMALASLSAAGCAPLPAYEARPARSSLGCMQAAIEGRDLIHLPDSEAHCLAAGLIARHCSVTEAMMASIGKEIRDAFGGGDAEWRDLRNDRRGIACARTGSGEDALRSCCGGSP
jgi:hypothetical protein